MNRSGWVTRFGAVALALACASTASAQWTSGSNGSDGALNITAQGVTVFDPVALNLDQDGDNVFHFTTINIAAGATLKLTGSKLRYRPVIFLATGDVTIAGTLDLSGANGYSHGPDISLRGPSEPGPGGYPGGVGGTSVSPARAGAGPGGAPTINSWGCTAAHATSVNCGVPVYGNPLLTPLVGGSGGAGGQGLSGGGGAGGGAIRITSATRIGLSGLVVADGGYGGAGGYGGGHGSGGAIHLQAPTISGPGQLKAVGAGGIGAIGRIRLDGDDVQLSGTVSPSPRKGPLQAMPLPGPPPTIAITRVNGLPVPDLPAGNAGAVDVTIDSAGPVVIDVSARHVKPGTVVKLWISSEVGADQFVDTSALAGTLTNSTASVTVTLPAGVSKLLAQAKWQ